MGMKIHLNSVFIISVFIFTLLIAVPTHIYASGPTAVNLLSASNFLILSETGITDTGSHTSIINGNIGSSPITGAAMNDIFCSEMIGTIYGVDTAYVGSGTQTCFAGNPPLSNKTLVDNAVLDMQTAYIDASGRTLPDATELFAGNLGGQIIIPGLYKWSTDVIIPTSVTLSGGANDVWIFQIAGDLNLASSGSIATGVKIILLGGAKAENVFWQVGGVTGATLGTYSTFSGNILTAKQIVLQTGAILNGRALAQTQVTLDANQILIPVILPPVPPVPATLHIIKQVNNLNGGVAIASSLNLHVKIAGSDVAGSPNVGVISPGTSYSLSSGVYVVSEDSFVGYNGIISGDCDSSGNITLLAGDNKICTITNTDIPIIIPIPPVPPTPTPTIIIGGGISNPQPLISLSKKVDQSVLQNPNMVTFTYEVKNIGNFAMIGVWVSDDKCSPANYVSGDSNNNSELDLNEIWEYKCSKIISQTETNIAKVHGQANGYDTYDSASTTVLVNNPPLSSISTSTNILNNDPPAQVIIAKINYPNFPNTGVNSNKIDWSDTLILVIISETVIIISMIILFIKTRD